MRVLLDKNKPIGFAETRYEQFSADQEARHAYLARQMFIHGQATMFGEALRKGKLEKARETAVKLKSMGLSLEQIAEATGLTKEEVDPL